MNLPWSTYAILCHRGSFWASRTKSWIFALAQAGINDAIVLLSDLSNTLHHISDISTWWLLMVFVMHLPRSKHKCIECTNHISDLCCIEFRLVEDGWNHKKSWRSVPTRYTNHISKLYSRLVHFWTCSEDTWGYTPCYLRSIKMDKQTLCLLRIPGTLKFCGKSNFHQGSIICKGFCSPMQNWQELNALKFCYDFLSCMEDGSLDTYGNKLSKSTGSRYTHLRQCESYQLLSQ